MVVAGDEISIREGFNILISHNMTDMVSFPTKICETKQSAIDTIFTYIHIKKTQILCLVTEISDYDAQLIGN